MGEQGFAIFLNHHKFIVGFLLSDGEKFKLIARTDKSTGVHSRIIWCCSWSHDSSYFATGSRDGKVVVWGESEEMHPVLGQFKSVSEHLDLPKESITSVAFALSFVLAKEAYLVAVGSEAGDIRLYGWSKHSETPWTFLYQLSGKYPFDFLNHLFTFCHYLINLTKFRESVHRGF